MTQKRQREDNGFLGRVRAITAVQRIVRPKKDHVRYYPICATCLKKVDVIGGVDVLGEQPAALVVG